jgi:hypothetical protein
MLSRRGTNRHGGVQESSKKSGAGKEADGVVHARQRGLGDLTRPIGVHREHSIQFGGIG